MNNENKDLYKPKITQIYYWKAYADPYSKPTIADVSRRAVEMMIEDGIGEEQIPKAESIRQMVYQWEKENGYKEWRDKYWNQLMSEARIILDKVGLQRGVKDFRYWEAMQMKFGNFSRRQDNVNTNVDVNDLRNAFNDDPDDKGTEYDEQQQPIK